jgi:hypothetical protein
MDAEGRKPIDGRVFVVPGQGRRGWRAGIQRQPNCSKAKAPACLQANHPLDLERRMRVDRVMRDRGRGFAGTTGGLCFGFAAATAVKVVDVATPATRAEQTPIALNSGYGQRKTDAAGEKAEQRQQRHNGAACSIAQFRPSSRQHRDVWPGTQGWGNVKVKLRVGKWCVKQEARDPQRICSSNERASSRWELASTAWRKCVKASERLSLARSISARL